jgi:hypothetical protein
MSGYIGTQPVPQSTQTRQTFTATASQTSFATGGYQAGYLDVFLNGVKLVDGTDYTATNGSDVVLTTGAASGDTLEVVAYTAFTVADQAFTGDISVENLDVTGSFTSQGIDDNATSTAMTLDSSGNLLVGTTDPLPADNAVEGFVYRNGLSMQVHRDAGPAAGFGRGTSDGAIVNFLKDGSSVGSIGSLSGDILTVGSGTSGFAIIGEAADAYPARIIPRQADGTSSNGLVDLGDSGARWKDLYLSGGVYLGGTGSANKLDDYEEGTWTPVITTTSGSATVQTGFDTLNYTKVGRVVTITGRFRIGTVTGTSGFIRINLPFTSAAYVEESGFAALHLLTYGTSLPANTISTFAEVNPNSTQAYFYAQRDNTTWVALDANGLADGDILYVNGTYTTA